MEEPIHYEYSDSLQVILVTTKDWNSTKGIARLYERKTTLSPWVLVTKSFRVVVGKNGLAWSRDVYPKGETLPVKTEGDKKSPAGIFMLTSIFSSNDITAKIPFTKLEESTECVDDAKSSHYNKIVDKFKVGKYDWHSSEKMLAVGEQYELGIFVSHNPKRNKGDGSCIFLHIWADANSSTAGCTAMNKQNMEQIVNWLDSTKKPFLVQLPNYVYEHYKVAWNLPGKQLK